MKDRRKSEYLEKTPDDELRKMPHTKTRKFKPRPRFEPAGLDNRHANHYTTPQDC